MTIEPIWMPVLFAVGVLAGFLNTVAGGGSFFSFPVLLLLGFSPHVANGTIRVTIVMQNIAAVSTYARAGRFPWKETLICSLVMVPAALLGAWTAVRMSPDPFRIVSAILVLVVLGTLFLSPKHWTREKALPRIRWAIALPALAAVGYYGGFFQLGVGVPFLAAAVLGGGWDLVTANKIKVSVILLYTAVALIVFAGAGQVDWVAGAAVGAGNMVGAWWGARSAVEKGPKWIRWVLVVVAVIAAVRLLVAPVLGGQLG